MRFATLQWILENYGLQCFSVHSPYLSYGGRSLVGYSPWGRKELDTTERSFPSLPSFPPKESKIHLTITCPLLTTKYSLFPHDCLKLTCLGSHATDPETILDYCLSLHIPFVSHYQILLKHTTESEWLSSLPPHWTTKSYLDSDYCHSFLADLPSSALTSLQFLFSRKQLED